MKLLELCPCCHAKYTEKPRCPKCGNAHTNRRTNVGWWRCGKCDNIFHPTPRGVDA